MMYHGIGAPYARLAAWMAPAKMANSGRPETGPIGNAPFGPSNPSRVPWPPGDDQRRHLALGQEFLAQVCACGGARPGRRRSAGRPHERRRLQVGGQRHRPMVRDVLGHQVREFLEIDLGHLGQEMPAAVLGQLVPEPEDVLLAGLGGPAA